MQHKQTYAIVVTRHYYGPRDTASPDINTAGMVTLRTRANARETIAAWERGWASYPMLSHNECSAPTYRIADVDGKGSFYGIEIGG